MGFDLRLLVDFTATVDPDVAGSLISDLRQVLIDLGLEDKLSVEEC